MTHDHFCTECPTIARAAYFAPRPSSVAPDAGVPSSLLPRAALALLLLRRLRVHGRLACIAAHPVDLPVVDDADLSVVGPLALRLGPLEAVHLAVALATRAARAGLVAVGALDPALRAGAARVPRRVRGRQQAAVRLVVAGRALARRRVVLVPDGLDVLAQRLGAQALLGGAPLGDAGVDDARVFARRGFVEGRRGGGRCAVAPTSSLLAVLINVKSRAVAEPDSSSHSPSLSSA